MKRNQRDFHSVEHLLKFHIQLQAISSLRARTEYVGGTTMYPEQRLDAGADILKYVLYK